MSKINESEQWLLDGKCHLCRKRDYCGKPCSKCKSRRTYEMRSVMAAALAKILDR